MSFAFVPRKVAKTSKEHTAPTLRVPVNTQNPLLPPPVPVLQQTRPVGLPSDQDICILLRLALSDYALWSDPKLLRVLVSEREAGNEGYTSLFSLLCHSPVLSGLNLEKHETLVAKALRMHARSAIEVQMLMSSSPTATWLAKGAHANTSSLGNYEVRRVNIDGHVASYTREDWEKRTLYMENIPPTIRNIPQLVAWIVSLLSLETHTDTVQHVELPKHHLAKPFTQPQLKGFALVTFSTVALRQQLHETWPWDTPSTIDDGSNEVLAAQRSGFRTLAKKRWEEFNEEYLAYRKRLAEETTAHQPLEPIPMVAPSQKTTQIATEPQHHISPDASFPSGCLVFVKHVHPDTNKTTLRALLSLAGDTIGIDYVDFKKGMDTCYLRIRTPAQADSLTGYFTERKLVQTDGLDVAGKPTSGVTRGKPVELEIVRGRAEEVYWERVPEKIRRDAVAKALSPS